MATAHRTATADNAPSPAPAAHAKNLAYKPGPRRDLPRAGDRPNAQNSTCLTQRRYEPRPKRTLRPNKNHGTEDRAPRHSRKTKSRKIANKGCRYQENSSTAATHPPPANARPNAHRPNAPKRPPPNTCPAQNSNARIQCQKSSGK